MGRNTTGQQAEVHDRQIRDMFAGIAGVYDRMNGLLSLGLDDRWRRHVALAIDPGATDVLDVCSGTGELLLAAKQFGRGSHHVASDFCEPMLRAGIRDNGLGEAADGVIAADTRARKSYLHLFPDSATRFIPGAAFRLSETSADHEAVLKQALLKHGLPRVLYLSLIHISEPTRPNAPTRIPSSA